MNAKLRVVRVVPVLDFGGVESGLVVHGRLHDRTAFDLRVCTFWKAGRAADAVRREGVPVDVLGVDPSIRIGRLRRTELMQLARTIFRFWRQRAAQPAVVNGDAPRPTERQ